jgi:hypothetical protein
MTDATHDSNSKPQDALPWLDRVVQLRYALLVISIVLAVDVARAPIHALGLPSFNWSATGATVPLGPLLVFACAYLFFMSSISPMIRLVVEGALRILLDLLPGGDREHNKREDWYGNGYVRVSEARKAALREKDSFWIARVNEHEARLKAKARETQFMASVSFSCLLLLVLEWLLGDRTSWTYVAGGWLMGLESNWIGNIAMLVTSLSLLLVGASWWSAFREPWNENPRHGWIEHPELAKQHAQKLKAG